MCKCANVQAGAEAAAALNDPFCVDAVLTDVNMPGVDGVMLAEILWSKRPDLKVIFMRGKLRPACARIFLPKPFSLVKLLGALDLALADQPIAHA